MIEWSTKSTRALIPATATHVTGVVPVLKYLLLQLLPLFQVKGDMIDVKVGWEPKTFKAEKVMQVNPPKMEKFDDVSNMTYLNEAAVLWNLKARYVAKLIYVSINHESFYFCPFLSMRNRIEISVCLSFFLTSERLNKWAFLYLEIYKHYI